MFEERIVEFKAKEHFMEVVPVGLWDSFFRARYNRDRLDQIGNALPLKVIPPVDVEKDFDLNITDLNTGSGNIKYKHFHNTGNGGIKFKIDVIIDPNETWGYGKAGGGNFVYYGVSYPARARIMVWLNYWLENMTRLYVVSDAIDIPNGEYILSATPKRKQDYRYYTQWSLEFTTYTQLTMQQYDANPSLYKWTGKTAQSTAKNTKLSNCELKNFVYKPKKCKGNTTQCTRWLQETLYKLGFVPTLSTSGCYDDNVANGVKNFQEKYHTKFSGMKVNGKMDAITLKALCSF